MPSTQLYTPKLKKVLLKLQNQNRLRVYTKNPQKPLIRDLIVEGLSLAKTQKEEFASILNSNNMDINALLNKLKEFVSS